MIMEVGWETIARGADKRVAAVNVRPQVIRLLDTSKHIDHFGMDNGSYRIKHFFCLLERQSNCNPVVCW